jgi:hypothetical protein
MIIRFFIALIKVPALLFAIIVSPVDAELANFICRKVGADKSPWIF